MPRSKITPTTKAHLAIAEAMDLHERRVRAHRRRLDSAIRLRDTAERSLYYALRAQDDFKKSIS